MCVRVCVYFCVCAYTCVCIYMCVHVCVLFCVCIYIGRQGRVGVVNKESVVGGL